MSLTAFLKENVANPYEEVEFIVSDRFKDEDGNPIAWKLRAMSPDNALLASDRATSVVGGKADFKTNDYFKNVVTESVIYPNLRDKELQDSYGVMDPKDLLNKMLNSREFNKLLSKCMTINGLNKDFDDLKTEVKN